MAISANASILAMLKVYYKKEGIQNLLFRNSPLLKKMNKCLSHTVCGILFWQSV